MASLSEAQQTIRAYDSKAQIMGIGFIFAMTMISRLLENFAIEWRYSVMELVLGFTVLVGPVALCGAVLYPTRATVTHGDDHAGRLKGCLFVDGHQPNTTGQFLADVLTADWHLELTDELFRTSELRAIKRTRFLRAVWAAGLSFVVIFAAYFVRLVFGV
ncbi:MAG: hypothetical protein AAF384_03800 [Pseudomonadota bacterium]